MKTTSVRNRVFVSVLFGLLVGCPVYSDDYADPDYGGQANCVPLCGSGYVCDLAANRCYLGNGGDCSTSGCPSGQICALYRGAVQCMYSSSKGPELGNMDATTARDAGAIDARYTDATSADTGGAKKQDANLPSLACSHDNDCQSADPKSKCLNALCVNLDGQCTDGSQCASDSSCVDGACQVKCRSGACPTGYSCDTKLGVCLGNPSSCKRNSPSCAAGLVCARERCVTPCETDGTCAGNLVCIDGGCVVDEQAKFVCSVEGQQDTCNPGSICVHHTCYVTCNPSQDNSCGQAGAANQCKWIQTPSKNYSVCAPNLTLGSECYLAFQQTCADQKKCVDGYCK